MFKLKKKEEKFLSHSFILLLLYHGAIISRPFNTKHQFESQLEL